MEEQVQCRVVNSADVRREFSGSPGLPASDVAKAVQNRGHMPPLRAGRDFSYTNLEVGEGQQEGCPSNRQRCVRVGRSAGSAMLGWGLCLDGVRVGDSQGTGPLRWAGSGRGGSVRWVKTLRLSPEA